MTGADIVGCGDANPNPGFEVLRLLAADQDSPHQLCDTIRRTLSDKHVWCSQAARGGRGVGAPHVSMKALYLGAGAVWVTRKERTGHAKPPRVRAVRGWCGCVELDPEADPAVGAVRVVAPVCANVLEGQRCFQQRREPGALLELAYGVGNQDELLVGGNDTRAGCGIGQKRPGADELELVVADDGIQLELRAREKSLIDCFLRFGVVHHRTPAANAAVGVCSRVGQSNVACVAHVVAAHERDFVCKRVQTDRAHRVAGRGLGLAARARVAELAAAVARLGRLTPALVASAERLVGFPVRRLALFAAVLDRATAGACFSGMFAANPACPHQKSGELIFRNAN
jgi:hypothetical protein